MANICIFVNVNNIYLNNDTFELAQNKFPEFSNFLLYKKEKKARIKKKSQQFFFLKENPQNNNNKTKLNTEKMMAGGMTNVKPADDEAQHVLDQVKRK